MMSFFSRFFNLGPQLFHFCIVGGVGTCINIITYTLATRFFLLTPVISAIIAFAIAVTNNYIFNTIWTFKDSGFKLKTKKYLSYIFGNLFSLAINLTILRAFIGLFGYELNIVGQLLGILFGMMFNFLFAKKFIFNINRKIFTLPLLEISPRNFLLFMLLGIGIAVIFHSILHLLKLPYPWNTFLFNPGDRFNDWHNSIRQVMAPNPYQAPGPALATYFPFTYVLLEIGNFQDRYLSLLVYFNVTLSLIFIGAYQAIKKMAPANPGLFNDSFKNVFYLALGTLITYPAIFALDRGNIDIWIAFLCVSFVINLNTKYRFIGCACITIAIALKGYPAAFLLLYLQDKQWRLMAISLVGAALFSLLPLLFLWGGISVNFFELQRNLNLFKAMYVLDAHSLFASSDPYNAIRMLFQYAQGVARGSLSAAPPWSNMGIIEFSTILLSGYMYFSILFASIFSIYAIFANTPKWRRVLAICLTCILFPAVANDYKLNLLFPALYLLIADNDSSKPNKIIFLVLCVLLIPKSYFFIDGRSISMLINPILLMILAVKTLYHPSAWAEIYHSAAIKIRQFRVTSKSKIF